METSIKEGKIAEVNVLRLNNDDKGHHCGYCNQQNSSHSFGFTSEKYSVELYDEMMLEGWRRCGDYVYKPNLDLSCCRLFTCRLDVSEFKINKKQRKVMRRFRKYISGKYEEKKQKIKDDVALKETKPSSSVNNTFASDLNAIAKAFIESKEYTDLFPNSSLENVFNDSFNKKLSLKRNMLKDEKVFGNYSSNVFLILINQMKKECSVEERKSLLEKLFQLFQAFSIKVTGNNIKSYKSSLSLIGHLNFTIINEEMHKSFTELVQNEQKNIKKAQKEFEKDKTIQKKNIYKSEYDEIVTDPPISKIIHKYSVELSSSIQADQEKFEVFKKYQMQIHKDPEHELSKDRYNHSWGCSNFKDKVPTNIPDDIKKKNIFPEYYGTYNFIHRLDGKIVAVGVWDYLPTSLSSVYLYYDPDYSFLEPGVFTAIKEIEYVQSFNKLILNKMKYYVMGFYCDSCQKMRYKGEYYPTQIRDYVTGNYVYLDKVRDKLKEKSILALSQETPSFISISAQEADNFINNIPLDFKSVNMNMKLLIQKTINKKYQTVIFNLIQRFIIVLGKKALKYIRFIMEFG